MDYILLRLTGFFIREGRNRRRCLVAAAGGALFSSISLCIPADQIPRLWSIGQIFCAAGIIRLAYPIQVMEKTCNGGPDILCACILKRWDLDGSDGKYPNDPGVIFVLCAFGTYLGISIVIHLLDVTEHVRSGSYPVVLKYCGREQQTQGFVDTGNLLADPVSGTPVSIVSWELMEMLLPEDLTERLACMQEKLRK